LRQLAPHAWLHLRLRLRRRRRLRCRPLRWQKESEAA